VTAFSNRENVERQRVAARQRSNDIHPGPVKTEWTPPKAKLDLRN
jgi:hypothetical protein